MTKLTYIFIINIFISSCGIYSFTGASVQPSLSQVFTEKLRDIFINQTSLSLTENQGDLVFSGYINSYKIKPIAIKANETAGKNRLTISVKAIYKNIFDTKNSFDENFSRYRDYESSQNITEVEDILIEEITNEIVEDVFNKAFVNW